MHINNHSGNVYIIAPVDALRRVTVNGGFADKPSLVPTPVAPRDGAFASAVSRALAQAGIAPLPAAGLVSITGNGTANRRDDARLDRPSATAPPAPTLGTFLQNLVNLLQPPRLSSQVGSTGVAATYVRESVSTVGTYAPPGRSAKGLAASHMESNLRALIDQFTTAPASSLTPGAPISASEDSATAFASLKDSYQNLISSLGAASEGSSTLGNFLQALSHNLQDVGSMGSIVNTHA